MGRAGFLISIPIPPSANGLFIWRRGREGSHRRTKAPRYRAWIEEAGKMVMTQRRGIKPISGPYRFFLTMPPIRGDADNRIKSASDLIVSMGLVSDDRYCIEFRAIVDREHAAGSATVAVEAA